jgi:hypothetical protein
MAKFTQSFSMDDDEAPKVLIEFPGSEGWNEVFGPVAWNWSDDLAEMRVVEEPPPSEGWEVVERVEHVAAPRPARWCREGNACSRGDCRYRHERCAHYDAWLARGKRGHNCRAMDTDPRSVRSPDEGGCKYDHRDPRDLTVTPAALPVQTEMELLDSFALRGLDCLAHGSFGFTRMRRSDKELLIRSLDAAKVKYEEFGDYMTIECQEDGPEVDMSTLPVGSKIQILESFGPKGLKVTDIPVAIGVFFDMSDMKKEDRMMLHRSLRSQNCEGEMSDDLVFVV